MMIDNQEIRTNGSLTAKVNLHKSVKNLKQGESVAVPIERLAYARTVASMINTARGYKSVSVCPDAENSAVYICCDDFR
ncbi:MAG: hypothetical protein K2M31_07750 [Muribaculaceae bacterium]|nr:hypothetical protein [Muribaculaceae bacterium]